MATGSRDELQGRTDLPLPEHLISLAHSRAQGTLAAADGESRREIVFVAGEIRAARSSLEEEMLGSWLLEREFITEDDLAVALLAQGGGDRPRLGQMLVTNELIDIAALEAELEALTVAIIRRAAADPDLTITFEEGQGADQPDTLPNMTTPQLILIAAREFPLLDRKRAALEPLDQVAWPGSALENLLDELDLTPSEAYLLSRLDGTRPLKSLSATFSLDEDEVIATLYALKTTGVLSLGKVHEHAGARPVLHASTHRAGPGEQVLVVDEEGLGKEQRKERATIRRLAEESRRLDHYRALELDQGATQRGVEQSWHKLQRLYSPDRCSELHLRDLRPQLTTVFERAREAFDLLSDPVARARYDPILSSVRGERFALDEDERRRQKVSEEARKILVEANFKRAGELISEGEPYLAIQLLEQACSLDPRPPKLLELARLLLRNPLWSARALATLRKAIEIDPGYVEAWLELANFWKRRKNRERERKSLERALVAAPDDVRACERYATMVGQRELERLQRRVMDRRQ